MSEILSNEKEEDLVAWLNSQVDLSSLPQEEIKLVRDSLNTLIIRGRDQEKIFRAMTMIRQDQLTSKEVLMNLILKYHKDNFPICGMLNSLLEKLEKRKLV